MYWGSLYWAWIRNDVNVEKVVFGKFSCSASTLFPSFGSKVFYKKLEYLKNLFSNNGQWHSNYCSIPGISKEYIITYGDKN